MNDKGYVEIEVDPSDRHYNTGYKLKAGKTYFISTNSEWMDFFIPTTGAGWKLPDWLTFIPIYLYEKIFSRRRFDPRERLGTLLYTIGDTNIKGAVRDGTFITVPMEYADENDKVLYLCVNDYNSRWHLENNFGKLRVKVFEM